MNVQPPCQFPCAVTLTCAVLFLGTACSPFDARSQAVSTAQGPDRAHVEEVLKGLNRGHSAGQVAVSPDGKRLAWVDWTKEGAEIKVAPLYELQKSERVTAAVKPELHCYEGAITWAPDAKALAFFSDCAKAGEQADLYLTQLDGTPARRLTELKGYVEAPAFSPDGTRVAFLYVEGAAHPAGALLGMTPPAGQIGEEGGATERVALAATDTAKPATPVLASPASLHVYEFDWSPDSKSLAYLAADVPGESKWSVAKLYTQPLGGAPKAILAPAEVSGPLHGLQIAVPRWSPDGKAIAFIGGRMSEQGVTGGDVWIVTSEGGAPRNLTAQRPTSSAWIEWEGNDYLFVSELAGSNCQLIRFHLQGDRTSPGGEISFGSPIFSFQGTVGDGRLKLSLSSTADHSLFVFNASTFDHPWEIYGARPGTVMTSGLEGVMKLSHFNDGVEPAWGKSVSISWRSDKVRLLGWLMLPKDYDSTKKYPLIVEVHGEPTSSVESHWVGDGGQSAAALSALGYFVLQPNLRGSYGQGEDFTLATRTDFGDGELRDILAGVDAVEAKYPVDPKRVGLTGWSYGGFKTMFALTQAGRFKAAVWGDRLLHWQDDCTESSIMQRLTGYFGAPIYDDLYIYAKNAAVNFHKQTHMPTLVVVGDRHGQCSAPMSYEFWHVQNVQNESSQPEFNPNEGHDFGNPADRREVMGWAVEWFAHYMPSGE